MRQPTTVVPEFFSEAEALRSAFEERFSDPYREDQANLHIWNYWYVDKMYMYLIARPEQVFPSDLWERFVRHLRTSAMTRFGLSVMSRPRLSLYVNGCHQQPHNDARNGRLGYVYSLTRWDQRRFDGGETMILRRDVDRYWSSGAAEMEQAGSSLFEMVPPIFNQLLTFDDRAIHAVRGVQGLMDPLAGRLVIHGHFTEGQMHIDGPLDPIAATKAVVRIQSGIAEILADYEALLSGLITVRLSVAIDGAISDAEALYWQLRRTRGEPLSDDEKGEIVRRTVAAARALRMGPASDPSTITVPIVFE